MADGLPNTNPMLGRLNKSAEETNELNKQIKEEGIDTNEAISEQLGLISSFTEVMKNYIPKLGFIDAHTQALKLKQDQAFKVLEKIEGHLAKQAEIVDDGPEEEPDADAEDVLPDEEVGGGGDGTPQPEEEAAEDTRDPDASPLEQIAQDVAAIRQKIVDGDEDTRDPSDPVDVDTGDSGGGGAGIPKKGTKKLGAIGKFLGKLSKLFTVLGVIVMALAFHWLGAKMQQTRISLISLILLLWGIPLYFFGWKLAKILIFPCSYLIFCVPLNFLDALSGPLQMIATSVAYNMLTGLGIECQRVGTQLISPFFQLNVEAPCSGSRSLLAMTALSAVYAYYTQKSFVKKWLLFIASIPIAVAGNIGRIISIALVSITAGQQFGTGLHHDWSGYVLFSLAISLMIGFGKILQINYKESFLKWKKVYLNRS